MKHLIESNKKKRIFFFKKELNYFIKKSFFNNRFLIKELSYIPNFIIFEKYFYLSKIRNRCVITGRGRGIYSKFFKINSKNLKLKLNFFYGMRKSSW